MTDMLTRHDLGEYLRQWVAAGLIDAEQAARIESAELTRATRIGGRAPLVVEALGYLGGALAVIAGFIAVGQLWPDIPTGVQLAFAAVAAVLLGVAGALLRHRADPAFGRLRAVLWLMSTASVTAFVGVLAAQVWHFTNLSAVLAAAAVTTGYAAALWRWAQTPLQHLVLFAGAAVTVGAGVARIDPDMPLWASGLAVWLLSALWAFVVYRGHLPPRTVGYLAAAVGLLVGAQLTMDTAAGHLLALATVGALLAGGVVLRNVWLLAVGALGVMLVVPTTAARYLPENLGAPLAIFVTGMVLLGVALWLARWSRPPPSTPSRSRPGEGE
ncbi:MAG TPA: DUF2157 domain-containing protein [Pilimelia sp.]|nr:DUF2157 domain-containing protein [Pilimelia sp.]